MAWTDPPVGSIRAMRFVIQAICAMRSGISREGHVLDSGPALRCLSEGGTGGSTGAHLGGFVV
jgi:hypothetical protein